MFLANLTGDQKRSFLSLAQKLIEADGLLQKDELSTLEQYKREMGAAPDSVAKEETLEESISVFQAGSKAVKKQVAFELLALACSDREYAKENDIKVIWALSLPGKVAPITSAEFIKETIYNILKEQK